MTFLKRWCLSVVDYAKLVANDYATVLGDIAQDFRKRPIRRGATLVPLALLVYAYRTNPTENDLLDALIERRQQMALVPNSIHSQRADAELEKRTICSQQNRLRHLNLVFLSILIEEPHSSDTYLYECHDKILKKWWWQRLDNVRDVGAFGRWFMLGSSFQDYDINEEEFRDKERIRNNSTLK